MMKTSAGAERALEAVEAFVNAAPMEVRSLFIEAAVGAKIPGISAELAQAQAQGGAPLAVSEGAREGLRQGLSGLISTLDALRDPAEGDPLKRAMNAIGGVRGKPFSWSELEDAMNVVAKARAEQTGQARAEQTGQKPIMRDVWTQVPKVPVSPKPTKAS